MTSIENLMKRAMELKSMGLNKKEIGNELHLSIPTVDWLLTRQVKTKKAPGDVRIGWRSIGVYPYRIELISLIMTDIIMEEITAQGKEITSIMGVSLNGISFANFIASNLEKELIIYRPHEKNQNIGLFSSNYASTDKKKIVIVDDVLGSGETLTAAIKAIEDSGSEPVLCVVLVNKTDKDEVKGIPLRALVRTILIT